VKRNRPVNLDSTTIAAVNLKSPIAIASIMHRISGVVIFPLIALLLYILQQSLASEQAFNAVKTNVLGGFVGGGLVFIALAALLYHFVTGTKHLIQDFGVGESWETGRLFALTALVIIAVLIVLAFLWMVL
jgi:succinate dehydrogenase / fumarate reductase cytochrome b subunit